MTFWGTRGSLPSPGPATVRYGGNTTCVEVFLSSGETVVIDSGTGIRTLGNELMMRGSPVRVKLLFTHAHWDHVQGFPFFVPAFIAGNHIDIYGAPSAQKLIRYDIFEASDSSYFPVKKADFKATCIFHEDPSEFPQLKNCKISSIPMNHPGGGFSYKFQEHGKVFVFATDFELGKVYPEGTSQEDFKNFVKNADLLVLDAQYTDEEILYTRGWGHSTYNEAVQFACAAHVKQLVLYHHDPKRSDDELDHIVAQIRTRLVEKGCPLEVLAAREGETLSI
ncbi:MAG: MBL fold metallo-hydrolase [bacterium]|nr:MBL fold metallo-hydrolase [bacterium]